MTVPEINTMLGELEIPYTYYQFSEATAKPAPFLCWYFADSDDLYADDENFVGIGTLIIELYTDAKDFALEAELEGILKASGLTWARSESYIDTEKLHETVYETEVLINA